MNTVLLNTVHLDGAPIVKKGSGGGSGVTINNQSKSVEITENGTTEVRYDAGYTGLEKVSVNVNVVSDNDIAETDAGICKALYDAGLCANETYITKEEAARITGDDLQPGTSSSTSVFYPQKANIKSFNGFKYFTNVTSIGVLCFKGCSSLTSINLPSGVTSLGEACFLDCYKLTSIELPSGLKSLGDRCFYNCNQLTSIELPSGVTSLGGSCFFGCSALTSINLPSGVTSLGDNCFYNCSSLTSIELPSGLTSLGSGCFQECNTLTSIELPSGVTSIRGGCFQRCPSLKTITSLATTAPTVSSSTFGSSTSNYTGLNTYNTGENTLYVPAGATGYDTGAWLDPLQNPEKCGFTIKYQGEINNQDKSIDIVDNGTAEIVADAGYTGLGKVTVNVNVPSSGGGSGWTGHADVEGLKAIGWTDEDIAYYQEHGVNWNAEDDEYHKVTDDNKALYGVLTASNISTYADRIVYLPKIDTSSVTGMSSMFQGCYSLVSIPHLNTANVTNMSYMFNDCYSLVSIPHLNTANVTNMSLMFNSCYSLVSIPQLDTSKVTNMSYMFNNCYSLVSIPQLDTSKVTNMKIMFNSCYSLVSIPQLDTSKVTDMSSMFIGCYSLVSIPHLNTANVWGMDSMFNSCRSLVSIPQLDMSKVTDMSKMFSSCYSLAHVNLKNSKQNCDLSNANLLSKESLLYLINEATTSAITIKLAPYAYTRLAEDADVVAALANHPNISISQ